MAVLMASSFLKLSDDGKLLFAVSELARADEPTGFVHSFNIAGNNFTKSAKVSSGGKAPCHLELDKTGRYLIVSNYVGGVATLYRVSDSGGLLKRDEFIVPLADFPGRDSWLHSAKVAPDNELMLSYPKALGPGTKCGLKTESCFTLSMNWPIPSA